MIDRTIKTQEQNTREIDYDNYPVVPIPDDDDGIRYRILFPSGQNFADYTCPEIARCDFRWYMEHWLDTPYGAK